MEPTSMMRHHVCKDQLSHTNFKFSPFDQNIIAVSSAANFGIVGRGSATVRALKGNQIVPIAVHEQKDAVFDISWCELSDQLLLLGTGVGAVFWNVQKGPVWRLDTPAEVISAQMAYKTPLFLAGSLNGELRVGDSQKAAFLFMLPSHMGPCNSAIWHPSDPKVFATCGGDGFLKLWDHTLPKQNTASLRAHEAGEAMCLDFNKYEQFMIATGSSDKSIKLWDMRNLKVPVNILVHHRYPVKRLRFSPHNATVLASGSFDMNVNVYNLQDPVKPLMITHARHTEFVSGVDFNMFNEKLIGSVGWDGRIFVWEYDKPQPAFS